ncbi:MAG: Aldehyde dehydrogenase [uncultured Thermomicrobiales bacterium]|uniref:Aldehyde dehydrogenase n=1 Tax=uncultured Thermomicrobiales bacterium TaxID=1645740 RepID=A0A6J4TXI8_9BACT|nr:MAG: Aldehyde dehydrogenase [uncultured Thermomicrobiales bacterium]
MQIAEIFETMTYGPAPEAAGPAREWLAARAPALGLFLDNRMVPPSTGEHIESTNPATGEPLIGIARAGSADVDAAVAAARRAAADWRRTPGHARARHLYALARQVQKHARLLAVLETLDNGKPIRESRDLDVPLVARHFYHHAGWAQLLETEFAGYEALGVVGQIVPWNFPLLMLAWKVAPALAAGNTVVLKPARFTSITAVAFAEIAARAGLPPGVLNVVTGDGQTGAMLVEHAGVDKIAFTGSTEVGRGIRRSTAGSGKRLSLELGGKSPFVVFDDADLDSAVEGVVDAIWFNQGQVCCAGSRLLVQEGVAAGFLERLRERMETLRVGDPLDKGIDIGAIVAPSQLETIRGLVDRACSEGIQMWQPSWACALPDGCFFPPTLFSDVPPAAEIARVEVFGPVLAATTFRTKSEAVALANNTGYGLAASVWSENVGMALDAARAIKAGTVWVNATNLFDAAAGFGGLRESGFGREGGREGMYEYLKPRWPGRVRAAVTATATGREPISEAAGDGSQDGAANGHGASNGRATGGFEATVASMPPIDRTPKLFVGGKQARPDSGYSRLVFAADSTVLGEVGEGNRKDLRNAVEAAHASPWGAMTGHARAQVLYYLAENLSLRTREFAERLRRMDGRPAEVATTEVERTIERLFAYAAWADKFGGRVQGTPMPGLTVAVHEPIGVVAVVADDTCPLLQFVSLVAPALAMGNAVVAVPSSRHPLAATDLYQVFETSDVPAGAVNVVTGNVDLLAGVLAGHDDVAAIWYAGSDDGARRVELESAGNLKRVWIVSRPRRDWFDPVQGEGEEFLREATQVKNIWVPAAG